MLEWVFGGKRKAGPAPDYEEAKKIAASGSKTERQGLASHADLQPEFLYYFATDTEPSVRRTVAANPGTPLQADVILAKDSDNDVRCALTQKIGDVLPDLSISQSERVGELVNEILETLANDQLPRVRALLAEEVKSLDNVPPRIAKMLAEDIEAQVAAPILQYSPLLTKSDLLDIIAKSVDSEKLVAVASREKLDAQVTAALVESEDVPAIGALLKNEGAEIGEWTMEKIVDIADGEDKLHEPLVTRGGLSASTITRIAGFVSASLLDPLIKHNALIDEKMAAHLRESVAERMSQTNKDVSEGLNSAHDDYTGYSDHPAYVKAKSLHAGGRLTERVIRESVAEQALQNAVEDIDIAFLVFALSLYADVTPKAIEKIFNQKDAKSLMAIAWQCQVKPDVVESIQRHIWRLPDEKMLKATVNRPYSLPEADLQWAFDLIKT